MTAAHGAVLPGKDVTGEVTFLARELKAPVIAQTFTALGDQAREQGWSHEEYLAAVLGRQVASRTANGTRMRLSAAHLPQVKTLEDFSAVDRHLAGRLPGREAERAPGHKSLG